MYNNAAAVSRPEITELLEEGRDVEKFYIAEKLAPVHNVKSRAGRYPRLKIGNGQLMSRDVTKRGPTGTYTEIARKSDWDTYNCEDLGLTERIDDANAEEMADFFDMEMITSRLIKRQMMIDMELRTAELIQNPAEFTATAAAVAYTEANLATIDFPLDLMNAIARLEQTAVEGNTLVIESNLWNRIRRSAKLQTFLFNNLNTSGTRLIKPADITEAFNGLNVLIAKANYNSANRAKEIDLEPIWSPGYIWVGKTQGGAFEAGGAARTLVWGADSPGGLYTTETWRDEIRRGDMIRVRSHIDSKVIDASCGQLITTSYA
jgi:hypothetical protein